MMHGYSLNNHYRKNAIIIMFIISLALNALLFVLVNSLFDSLEEKFDIFSKIFEFCDRIGIGLNIFTVTTLFGLIYILFDKFFWKIKAIQNLHNIPNLNGDWYGYIESSYKDEDGNSITKGVTVNIVQTWTKITIKSSFSETSSSFSNSASFDINNLEGPKLTFTYENNANVPNWEIQKHEGCNILIYNENTLNGRYFTNRGKGTHGIIFLTKVEDISEEIKNNKMKPFLINQL